MMAEWLSDILDWIALLSPVWIYAVVLVVSWLENVVPPVPGDLLVVFAGYLAGLGKADPMLLVGVATVGGTLGFMTMFAAGRRLGDAVLAPDRLTWLPKKRIVRARVHVARWGYTLVATNRFLSGLRSVISLSVGISGKRAWPTLFWSAASSLVWCFLLVYGGVYLGANWERVSDWLQAWGWVMTGVLVLVVVLRLVWIRKRRPQNA